MEYPLLPQISGRQDGVLTNMSVSLGEPYTTMGAPAHWRFGVWVIWALGGPISRGAPYCAYTGLTTISVGGIGSYRSVAALHNALTGKFIYIIGWDISVLFQVLWIWIPFSSEHRLASRKLNCHKVNGQQTTWKRRFEQITPCICYLFTQEGCGRQWDSYSTAWVCSAC